ncbi:hypothetical protein LEP1GSC021_1180 [Leptospira noguchii str. 1993005606]|uniref:Uncharacterized protein n=2 Tax=Leptospira noguchii TaxID=28182 RepID=M6YBL1_9LEPT|nr:hypothetical protein LEP1GSC035_3333 [Leptospira noguchii str. 2007001578]EMO91155.1 hypothetical protein LEP1GSC024_2055 [Leptospira noguchii str. 2001034031]EPE81910.1 hypothetical protein LEP1GSC021_1180 [Leptospira noguchii str. 1993005606]
MAINKTASIGLAVSIKQKLSGKLIIQQLYYLYRILKLNL